MDKWKLKIIKFSKIPNISPPPNVSPPEYKPSKMCLKIALSPGLIFGILRYLKISKYET